jgi:ABC-type enterochelin transport system permease subunit
MICGVSYHMSCRQIFKDYSILTVFFLHTRSDMYCNGPLPFNGQLVTDIVSVVTDADIVSAVTDADIVTAATVMHCDWVEAFQR